MCSLRKKRLRTQMLQSSDVPTEQTVQLFALRNMWTGRESTQRSDLRYFQMHSTCRELFERSACNVAGTKTHSPTCSSTLHYAICCSTLLLPHQGRETMHSRIWLGVWTLRSVHGTKRWAWMQELQIRRLGLNFFFCRVHNVHCEREPILSE